MEKKEVPIQQRSQSAINQKVGCFSHPELNAFYPGGLRFGRKLGKSWPKPERCMKGSLAAQLGGIGRILRRKNKNHPHP